MEKVWIAVFVLVWNCSSNISARGVDDVVKFVEDFASNENRPSVFNVRSSWTQNDKIRFATSINTSVQYINEISVVPTDGAFNQIFFFIDMNDSDSVEFLLKVKRFLSMKIIRI